MSTIHRHRSPRGSQPSHPNHHNKHRECGKEGRVQRIDSSQAGQTARSRQRVYTIPLHDHSTVFAKIDCAVEVVNVPTSTTKEVVGHAKDVAQPTQLTLCTADGVPLDVLFKVPRGTPDEHLEWMLKKSLEKLETMKREKGE